MAFLASTPGSHLLPSRATRRRAANRRMIGRRKGTARPEDGMEATKRKARRRGKGGVYGPCRVGSSFALYGPHGLPMQALRSVVKSEMDRKRGLLAATGSLARLKKKSSTATMFYQSKLVTSTSSYFLRQKNIGFIPGKLVQI